jgi:hypothetical protein
MPMVWHRVSSRVRRQSLQRRVLVARFTEWSHAAILRGGVSARKAGSSVVMLLTNYAFSRYGFGFVEKAHANREPSRLFRRVDGVKPKHTAWSVADW